MSSKAAAAPKRAAPLASAETLKRQKTAALAPAKHRAPVEEEEAAEAPQETTTSTNGEQQQQDEDAMEIVVPVVDFNAPGATKAIAALHNARPMMPPYRVTAAFERTCSAVALAGIKLVSKKLENNEYQDYVYDYFNADNKPLVIHLPPLLVKIIYYCCVGISQAREEEDPTKPKKAPRDPDVGREFFMALQVVTDSTLCKMWPGLEPRLKNFVRLFRNLRFRLMELAFNEPTFDSDGASKALSQVLNEEQNKLYKQRKNEEAEALTIESDMIRKKAITLFWETGRIWDEVKVEVPVTDEDRNTRRAALKKEKKTEDQIQEEISKMKTKVKKVVDGLIRAKTKVFWPRKDAASDVNTNTAAAASGPAKPPQVVGSLADITASRSVVNSAAPGASSVLASGASRGAGGKKYTRKDNGWRDKEADVRAIIDSMTAKGYEYGQPEWRDIKGKTITCPEGKYPPLFKVAEENDLVEITVSPNLYRTKTNVRGIRLYIKGSPYFVLKGPGPTPREAFMEGGGEGGEGGPDDISFYPPGLGESADLSGFMKRYSNALGSERTDGQHQAILAELRKADPSSNGYTIQDVAAALQQDKESIRRTFEELAGEGYVYTTVDEDHFHAIPKETLDAALQGHE